MPHNTAATDNSTAAQAESSILLCLVSCKDWRNCSLSSLFSDFVTPQRRLKSLEWRVLMSAISFEAV